jgi:tight adherence protein C
MPIIVWLASAAIAASLPIAWWAISGDRAGLTRRVNQNLAVDNAPHRELNMRDAMLERSVLERWLAPGARGLGGRLLRYTPVGWSTGKATMLAKAGLTGRITPEQILGAKVLLPLVTGGLLGLRLLSQPSTTGVLVFVLFILVAFFVPDLLLRARADRRADEITVALPDVLDQLTILVEAGLGFEAAMARVVQTDNRPLAQEFGRMLQDIQLGTRRIDALDGLAKRSHVDDLKVLVLALRQAEALGSPLAKTLRTLSLEMREKRKFRAEERAHQLPVKMIFPLGLCILPAMMIVILGPAAISIARAFSH